MEHLGYVTICVCVYLLESVSYDEIVSIVLPSVTLWDLLYAAGIGFCPVSNCFFCMLINHFSLWCLLSTQ